MMMMSGRCGDDQLWRLKVGPLGSVASTCEATRGIVFRSRGYPSRLELVVVCGKGCFELQWAIPHRDSFSRPLSHKVVDAAVVRVPSLFVVGRAPGAAPFPHPTSRFAALRARR